jgi:hypothetical protein
VITQPGLTTLKRRLRFTTLAFGILFFAWITIEDTSTQWVMILGIGGSILATISILVYNNHDHLSPWLVYPSSGLLCGLLVTPLAVVLMAVKTGLHSHITPDFSLQQIILVLKTTPIWAVSGLLVGTGTAIWRQGKNHA